MRRLETIGLRFASSKWAKIAQCSADTIQDLIKKEVLQKEAITNHELVVPNNK